MMRSHFLKGKVYHVRLHPKTHSFIYPVVYLRLDLDEFELIDKRFKFLKINRFAALSIQERDYLPGMPGNLQQRVKAYLKSSGLDVEIKRIELVTMPRVFGYVFNPVSFYYCYDESGITQAQIAEVNNTFGEKHIYIMQNDNTSSKPINSYAFDKEFHVSPFLERHGEYEFKFNQAMEETEVQADLYQNGEKVFTSGLKAKATTLTDKSILKMFILQPLTIVATMPRILWQAAKLYFGKRLEVYTKPVPLNEMTVVCAPQRLRDKLGRFFIYNFLKRISKGSLTLLLPDGSRKVFTSNKDGHTANIEIKDFRFFWRIASQGDIGFGESYMIGEWTSPDVKQVLLFFIDNRSTMDDESFFAAFIGRIINRLIHLANKNDVSGSKKNIQAHYDLSNEFFKTFLDTSMTYSCAIFQDASHSLDQAQHNKVQAILNKAQLRPEHHILEIGSGWGTLAIRAAQEFGCKVTTITLSEEQKALAEERIKAEGLTDKVEVLLEDYRRVSGKYDRIISVEMLEAVGHENLPAFFERCNELLNPNGLVVLQVITMPDHRYEQYRKSCDWIQRYIFPGAVVPSVTALNLAIRRKTPFVIEHMENIGVHYARTLSEWRKTFCEQSAKIKALGFDETFQRMWEYYLLYCEAGFASRTLGTHQIVLTRPNNNSLKSCPGY